MLFNCLQCCKAISSRVAQCPYCRIDIEAMVRQLAVTKEPEPTPVLTAEQNRRQLEKATPGTLVYRALANVGQIVRVMRKHGT